MEKEKTIKQKIDKLIIEKSGKMGVINSMLALIIVPLLLLVFDSFLFSLFLSSITSYIAYRISKETYINNPKIIKGDGINILYVMCTAITFNYILLFTLIYFHWSAAIVLVVLVLFELNTLGEYYNMEEIQKIN
jgi:hypothetical protein